MVAGDFNGAAWRRRSGNEQRRDSTIEDPPIAHMRSKAIGLPSPECVSKKKRWCRLEESSPTPNVAVTNPDSVARNRSLHFDNILHSGLGERYGGCLECHPRSGARSRLHAGDSLVPFTADSFEAFDASAGRRSLTTT